MTTTTDLRKLPSAEERHAALVPRAPGLPGLTNETASTAMAAKATALVQARYAVAYARPRDPDVVRQRLLKECERPSFADVAEYNKPIGKGVKGPSIRFVETAIRCMTNILTEVTTIYDDSEKRIVNVGVTDLESNTPYAQDVTITKTVERSSYKEGDTVLKERLNSYNKKVYTLEATDDDILNKQNALISKAIRTQGLRLIPGDLVDEAMDTIHATMKNRDAEDPDTAKRKLYDGFADQGVPVDQLKLYLGHDGSTLSPKELTTLRGLYTALKDGETSWREIMDNRDSKEPPAKQPTAVEIAEQERKAAEAEKATNAKKAAAVAKATPAEPKAEPKKAADQPITSGVAGAGAQPAVAAQVDKALADASEEGDQSGKPDTSELMQRAARAETLDELDIITDFVTEIDSEEHRAMLIRLIQGRRTAIDKKKAPPPKQEAPAPKEETAADEPPARTRTPRNRPNFD